MGLDMYLTKKYYVKNGDYMEAEKKHTITVLKGGKPTNIPTDKITYITVEIMYWRKANAIHKWFVDNVQDGNDDCGTYYVDSDQLKELLDICNKIIDNSRLVKAKIVNGYKIEHGKSTPIMVDGETIEDNTVAAELLPTQNGFFFGGTDYDQYYYQDIKETIEGLTEALKDDDGGDFYYHSSW
jgi:hypothetical protein